MVDRFRRARFSCAVLMAVFPGVSGAQVVVPVSAVAVPTSRNSVSPVSAPIVGTEAVVSSGQMVFGAPVGDTAAQPVAFGLPEPSIIVGRITEARFETAEEQGEVQSSVIAYDDLEARVALRESDPDLYADLVLAGALDPPEDILPLALQTELQRMGCYRSTLDNVWGGGSRASVERYFDEVPDVEAPTLEPTFELFRAIIRREDVECPVPVAATPAPQPAASGAGGGGGGGGQAPAAAPRPAPQPAPQPAPAPQNSGRSLTGGGVGVFR